MGWGAAALDADSDGWTDLYVALGTDPAGQGEWATTNRLLRNAGRGKFEDVTRRGGAADSADSFGVAVGDANGDGQADIVVGDYDAGYRLFLGTGGGAAGHRLVVRLTGAGPVNRDAVGARIEAVLSDGRRLVHEVSLGGTLGGNDDPALRTGTGTAAVSQLNVRWPNGYEQAIKDVPIDSEVRWTYATAPELRPLPPIASHGDQLYNTHTPSLGLGMTMPVGGALACFALVALWLVGRRRAGMLGYAAGGSLAVASHVTAPSLPRPLRSLRFRGHNYPVILPALRDSRLHLASVIFSLQILGQAVLGFQLSIAQILVSLLTCAIIEFTITFRRTRSIVWPASALLTGNGVAFILRVPGTEHGDWWSLNGWYLFAGIAGVSLLSKYLIRDDGRHVFNPSNFGLVLGFLLLGSSRVEPLDFWWGPISPGVTAALIIILVGGPIILSRLHLLGMAIAFWLTFAAGLAVIAAGGHCMSARWSFGPVCGWSFWRVLVTSPEILVFMFFMMTDPRTTPAGRVARILFGVAVAFLATLFLAPQQTEFSTKVAVLASLAVVCALQPMVEKFLPAAGSERDTVRALLAGLGGSRSLTGMAPSWARGARYGGLALVVGSASFASLIASGAPARVPVTGLQAAEATVSRPVIDIDASALPAVTIDPAMRRLDADITDARATEIARDVAADLKIEADALQKADRELAKTAAAGARLNSLWRQMDSARQTGQITVSSYAFDSMKLVPIYDPANAQAGPQYGLEVRGTVQRATHEGSSAAHFVMQEEEPFECTFALLLKNGHFLIAADYPLPRP
ncbi:MAG TPA: FG-GAP-like repeat-containing protein, partial [Dehalococcoidia bacterium]|nr:FG-GAP-like repeat-containing protein [Dehalococcoidia bacterium]